MVILLLHYLLPCPNFSYKRLTLFNKIPCIGENITGKDDSNISKLLLFGAHSCLWCTLIKNNFA